MKKVRTSLLSFAAVMGLVAAPLVPVTVHAQSNPVDEISQGVQGVGGNDANTEDLQDNIKTIVNILLFILGAIAVIMIIVGGIRYTTSNGEASSIKAAKDTILYSVIGLIVAILAYAIVNFVLGAFNGN